MFVRRFQATCLLYHILTGLSTTFFAFFRTFQIVYSEETIQNLKYSGLNFDEWLCGFDTNEQSVRKTINALENNPLLPKDVWVEGFVMDTVTGKLTAVPKATN